MLTEDFCSFEVAQLLKEKGFDELCIFKYNSEGVRMKAGVAIDEWQNSELDDDEYSCPSQAMVMKWLREVHNLFIEPYVVKNYSKKKLEYTYSIQDLDFQGSDDGIECCKNWDTPEQACETAIKYCLENLI